MSEHGRWEAAWLEAYEAEAPPSKGKPAETEGGWLSKRRSGRPRLLHVGVAALVIGTVASPFAVAATGDALREGVRNGTTTRETEIIGQINANPGTGGYVTRQSNIRTGGSAGGAAIYGCRGDAGGTSGGSAPCLRASNLANGLAFEFNVNNGNQVGLFSVGNPAVAAPAARPFTTNATAVATGLNADRVDGFDAAQLRGATGPAGPAGPSGPAGPAGSARAFGFVNSNNGGAPTLTRAQGFTAVRRDAAGVYCIAAPAAISPGTSVALVTVEWLNTTNPEGDTLAMWQVGGSSNANEFAVRTDRGNGPDPAAPADNVSFSILVP